MANTKRVTLILSGDEVEVFSTSTGAFKFLGLNPNTYKAKWVDNRIWYKNYRIYRREIQR